MYRKLLAHGWHVTSNEVEVIAGLGAREALSELETNHIAGD